MKRMNNINKKTMSKQAKSLSNQEQIIHNFLSYELWQSYNIKFKQFDVSATTDQNTFYFQIDENKKKIWKNVVDKHFQNENCLFQINQIFKTLIVLHPTLISAVDFDLEKLLKLKVKLKIEKQLVTAAIDKIALSFLYKFYKGDILEKIIYLVESQVNKALKEYFRQLSMDAGNQKEPCTHINLKTPSCK